MDATTCISIKSVKEPHLKCGCKALRNNLCARHAKQKSVKIWNKDALEFNPLMSSNDIDPVTLDVIWTLKKKDTRVLGDLKKKDIFTYVTEVNNQTFIRSLNMMTMSNLLDNYEFPKCPFSNLPFSNIVLENAKKKITNAKQKKQKYTKVEQYRLNMANILDKFRECGYLDVRLNWLYDMSMDDVIKWNYEFIIIYNNFQNDFPDFSLGETSRYVNKYERNHHAIVSNLCNFCQINAMCVQIVITSLAWTNHSVHMVYPSLRL